ncbi:unnamed protein product [Rotaria magnacalcarata]|uniref:Transposase n=2 Tax=Rotaria magnacalcarata TaxID=392030 RepID=A0A820FFW9_9BILA|nr:unnamed protein product [Rotaria magnacalcarata]CAF4261544.1 unnamed protein product [Rotaria magnacalcarata]
MIRGDVSSHGKTTLCFVELGAKININYYINNILKPFLRRDAPRSFPENGRVKWFLHQDSAPSHTPVEENDQGSNTAVCSIEYDNITPVLRGFTADIRCPCMTVILPLLKRLNTA